MRPFYVPLVRAVEDGVPHCGCEVGVIWCTRLCDFAIYEGLWAFALLVWLGVLVDFFTRVVAYVYRAGADFFVGQVALLERLRSCWLWVLRELLVLAQTSSGNIGKSVEPGSIPAPVNMA